MNDSCLELLENACSWWENLDDGKKSEFITELYCKEHKIRME
jgi:hypothetical protein